TAGAVGFAASIRALFAAIGPAGWFVIAVSTLTVFFQRMGRAAREAGEEARRALAEFRDDIRGLSDEELDARKTAIGTQIRKVKEQITALKADMVRAGRGAHVVAEQIAEKEAELNTLRQQGLEIVKERIRREREAAKAEAEAGAGAGAPTGLTPEEIRKREEALNREVSL